MHWLSSPRNASQLHNDSMLIYALRAERHVCSRAVCKGDKLSVGRNDFHILIW